ncbi:MAG: hypothetical protein ABSC23_03765 [Bryobacteraceae bacterium]
MMADGVINLDERPAVAAVDRANTALDGHEQKVKTVLDRTGKEWEVLGGTVVRVSDRSKTSLDRLLQSMERQAQIAGKTGVERLVAERDQLIARWQKEQSAVDAITRSYEKLIAAESLKGGADGLKKISDDSQMARGSLALMGQEIGVHVPRALRGFLAELSGVGPVMSAAFGAFALIGLVEIIDQAVKKVVELVNQFKQIGEQPHKIEMAFNSLNIETQKVNDELSRENTNLENSIAKLEHKPQNLLAEALNDARINADELAQSLNKDADSLAKLIKENHVGGVINWFMGVQGTGDIEDWAKKYQAKLNDINYTGSSNVHAATTKDAAKKAQDDWGAAIAQERDNALKQVNAWIKQAQTPQPAGKGTIFQQDDNPQERAARLAMLKGVATQLNDQADLASLRTEHQALTGKHDALGSASANTTEELRRELARAQEGELNGLDKINAAYDERLRHLREELQLNAVNAALAKQIRDAEVERFQKEEHRQTANAQFSADNSLAEARIRGGQTVFQAERRASGAQFGAEDIDAEYRSAMQLAQAQADLAEHHIQDLRDANATQGEIERARIEATKNFALAALDAETKRRVELIDLAKQQRDEEDRTAKANYENSRKLDDARAGEQERHDRDAIQRQIKITEASGLRTPGGQLGTAATVEQLRVSAAQIQHDQAVARINRQIMDAGTLPGNTPEERRQRDSVLNNLKIDALKAEGELQRQIDDAHEDRVLKAVEIQKQQFDEIAKESAGLWNTLLTKPQEFGKQLSSTLHAAILKPITEGLSNITANVLKPVIFGADGQGGIAGLFKGAFGGKQDPMKVATDLNTTVTAQNSMALATLTAIIAGGLGMGAPAVAAPAGIGGLSVPSISAPAIAGGGAGGFSLPAIFGGGSSRGASAGGGSPLSMILGGGGQGSAATPPFLPSNSNGGASGSGGGGLAGMLKNFKSIKWGGLTHGAPTYGTDEDGSDVQTGNGKITGVNGMAGAALFAGGSMLAQQGLLGSSRGTWGGIAMGTAGGAAIGFQQGGWLGAAIGGGIGALIGIGEKLAGVESPENEAKRLVKQLYGVNIDTAMAKQIVGIAQQKYANTVSVAVRDPDVRKMLELYAQGTGQKMPLSAATPVGGSLAEQGGRLYQQASYVNGTPYTFQSNLPVLGGLSGGNYPTPGGPNTAGGSGMTFALNINGQPITPEFVTDQSMAAQGSSYYRTQQSANMQVPGLMVS